MAVPFRQAVEFLGECPEFGWPVAGTDDTGEQQEQGLVFGVCVELWLSEGGQQEEEFLILC